MILSLSPWLHCFGQFSEQSELRTTEYQGWGNCKEHEVLLAHFTGVESEVKKNVVTHPAGCKTKAAAGFVGFSREALGSAPATAG